MPKLSIDIEARLAKFQDQLDGIARQGADTAKKLESSFGRVGAGLDARLFGGLRDELAGLTATLTAGAFASFVKGGIDAADTLGKVSERVGVAVESLSALQYAASLSDLSNEQLAQGLTKLAKGAADTAAGTGEAQSAFRALGVSVKDSQGNLRGTEELLLDLADKFAGIEKGSGKTALALRIFGESGAALLPFLNQGRAGFEALRKEAERLGIIVSTETAKAAEQFNDNLTRLAAASSGAKFALAESLLPALTRVSERMTEVVRNGEGLIAFFGAFKELSPFSDLQRAQKELTELTDRILSNEARLGRVGDSSFGDAARSALSQRIDADKARAEELIKLLRVLRGETNALGDPVAQRPAAQQRAPALPGDDSERKRGEAFIAMLDKRLLALRENEFAVLRLEAAESKVTAAAGPRIAQLEALTLSMQKQKEAQQANAAAIEAEAARRENALQSLGDYIRELNNEASVATMSNSQRQLTLKLLELERAGVSATSREYQIYKQQLQDAIDVSDTAKIVDDVRTPLEKYTQTVERLDELLQKGRLDFETYARAVRKAEEGLLGTSKAAKDVDDIAQQLGLTFSSAFEKAVLDGGKLRDVIKGLGRDIAQIVLRKTVTEPLAKKITGVLGDFDLGKLFGSSSLIGDFSSLPFAANGADWKVGGTGGTDSQLVAFRATPGERVTVQTPGQQGSGGATVVNLNIGPGTPAGIRAEVMSMMPTIVSAVQSAMIDSKRRGGGFGAAFS